MKKQKIKKSIEQYSGITLISLVITIIILIILAGVTLSLVLGENGLLAKARKGAEDYQYAGLRERIESEILALDIEKVTKGETLTIEDALIGLQASSTFEETDATSNSGICEGYVVELGYNENGKVVINGITKDTGTRIVATLSPTGYTNSKVEVTIEVRSDGKNVTTIEVPTEMTKKAGTNEQDYIYEVTANGTYHVKATLNDGTVVEKDIVIATIDTLPPQDFTITAENTGTGIIVTAETEDADANDTNAKSGMDKYEYVVTDASKTVTTYTTNPIENLENGKYSVYVIAYDKVGNHKQSTNTEEVEVKQKLKFQQVAVGDSHSLGIDMDGNLWTWGRNGNGQLGDGTNDEKRIPTKIIVQGEPSIKWKQVAGGEHYSLAIDENGNLWTWGANEYGQLGDGTNIDKNVPTKITLENEPNKKWKQVVAGYKHNLAIDENGNLWAWGYNKYGQLGDGTTKDKSIPTKIEIQGNTKFKQISAGYFCNQAIDTDGNLWAWGYNGYGQLGDGTTKDKLIPTKIEIQDNIKFKQISAGVSVVLAIDENNELWGWGYNGNGQLGDGSNENKNIPTKINRLEIKNVKFTEVSSKRNFYLAIDENGNLWTWGQNDYGQLGDGTKEDKNIPTKVTIKENVKCKQIALGISYAHNLIIDENSYLWAWGQNNTGQLGDGTSTYRYIPTPIAQ